IQVGRRPTEIERPLLLAQFRVKTADIAAVDRENLGKLAEQFLAVWRLVSALHQLEQVLHQESLNVIGELVPITQRHRSLAANLLIPIAAAIQLSIGDDAGAIVLQIILNAPSCAEKMPRLQAKHRI